MSRGAGYILYKQPPAPSPGEKVKRQRRADGLAADAVNIISAARQDAPLEVHFFILCHVGTLRIQMFTVECCFFPSEARMSWFQTQETQLQ